VLAGAFLEASTDDPSVVGGVDGGAPCASSRVLGWLKFHVTAVLLIVLWPMMHFSIAGLLLHVVQRPYRILNFGPVVWLGKMSYSLYLWQQLFTFGEHARPW